MSKPITKDMTLSQVLEMIPDSSEVFAIFGLHCANCALNQEETIEMGVKGHGMTQEDLDDLLEELNELAKTHGRDS